MAGVVELMGSPSVWRVLVFSSDGDTRVVKDEEPLVSGTEVQQMRQHRLQRAAVTDDQYGLVPLLMFGENFPQNPAYSFPRVAH